MSDTNYIWVAPRISTSTTTAPDPEGTQPIPINGFQVKRITNLFRDNLYLRIANEEIKSKLFIHAFDASLEQGGENLFKKQFKKEIIEEYWLPALRKIHDWLLLYGIAPYKIVPFELPVISLPSSKVQKKTKVKVKVPPQQKKPVQEKRKAKDTLPELPDYLKPSSSKDKDDRSSKTTPPSETEPKEKKEDGGDGDDDDGDDDDDGPTFKTYNEIHYIIEVPNIEAGYISTYINRDSKQCFVWTWHREALPPNHESTDGYSDHDMLFIVKSSPTITGDITTPVQACVHDWIRLNNRKVIEILFMRDHLNPLVFVEKQEKKAVVNPTSAAEMASTFSSAFNRGDLASLEGTGGTAPFTINKLGQINLGHSTSVALDTSRMDGATDMGLMSGGSKAPPIDYRDVLKVLEFNRTPRLPGSSSILSSAGSESTTPYDFGGLGLTDEAVTNTSLFGHVLVGGNDSVLKNPMSGVTLRVKRMEEGEKITEVKNAGLDMFTSSSTPIEVMERALDEKLCLIAGYHPSLLSGRTGGVSSSDASAKKTDTSGSSGKHQSKDATVSLNFVNTSLRQYKAYYESIIGVIFKRCYSESFAKSKHKLLQKLHASDWYLINDLFNVTISIPIDPPIVSSAALMNAYSCGLVTAEEVIRNERLNLGLSLDVMKNSKFVANAIKKLNDNWDSEAQLKLQKKYETKNEGGTGGGGGGKTTTKKKATAKKDDKGNKAGKGTKRKVSSGESSQEKSSTSNSKSKDKNSEKPKAKKQKK